MNDDARRQAVEKTRKFPQKRIRELAEESFILACDILTYNWINGNPRTEWEGKPFDWHLVGGHFKHWYSEIRENPANMFLAGRKHTKTTFADCLMIWRCEYNPGHVGLYWSNTQQQVKDRMEEFDEIVAANPWLENVTADTATFNKTFPGNGSKVDTAWVTKGHEGSHADTVLGDDPMKELGDIADTEVEHWYSNVIVPMLNAGEPLHATIGTRKRPNDLYEILRKRHEAEGFDQYDEMSGYNLVEYPAIRELWLQEYDRPQDLAPEELYTTDDAPVLADALGVPGDELSLLWPEARGVNFLRRNLNMQGESNFLREFCMVYTQVEDAVVHREWIDATTAERKPPTRFADPWVPADYPEAVGRRSFDRVVVGHDPAGKGRDRFAFVTVGQLTHPHDSLPAEVQRLAVDDEGEPRDVAIRHILDAWQAQDVPPSRWREKLTALHDRYSPDEIAIESNLNATWTMDDDAIPDRVQRRIEPVATGAGKHSWRDGVPSIGGDIESGKYRFYTGGGDENMTGDLITALTTVQRDPETGELVGHTPDLVMALYMAHKRLSDGGRAASSRTNLKHGDSERARERERSEREKREALKGNPIGDAILDSADGGGWG